jgi:methionyl-tRNA formyltransferase
VDIGPDETAGELSVRLARLGAETLVEVLDRLGELDPVPQDEARVSWAPLLKKTDGLVDWRKSAQQLHDHVRGMHPWPCAATVYAGEQLKIHRSRALSLEGELGLPGTVLRHSPEGLDVACGRGALRLLELQLPGKKRLDSRQFRAGKQIPAGTVLGGAG